MRINSIKIENLFDIFDYDISFSQHENVLIITGPNGYGKTMILNIIFNLFNRKFLFFQELVFEKITLSLSEKILITISKNNKNKKSHIDFTFYKNERTLEKIDFSSVYESDIERSIQMYLPVQKVGPDRWTEMRTDRFLLSTAEVLNQYADQLPNEISNKLFRIKSEQVNAILDSLQVHLIKEQRLFRKAQNVERNRREEKEQTIMIESIQSYAKELKQLIAESSQKSFIQTQELDSSYPNRLRSETNILTREDYETRYNTLKAKQKKLTEFGLYESKQEFLTYSEDDAKALSVYLKDFERKLSVFDDLLEKLELFSNILNERRFTFKSININRTKGFFFKTSKGKELELNQLSSGEQHEVVLLYELIFNVKPNILVLIDEPEISLHITWQKEFLNDLLKIIKIQDIQVVVATHSPSIINDRWDLVYNLETVKVK
jgi:predicted ATP-binding protein involved in virulence